MHLLPNLTLDLSTLNDRSAGLREVLETIGGLSVAPMNKVWRTWRAPLFSLRSDPSAGLEIQEAVVEADF